MIHRRSFIVGMLATPLALKSQSVLACSRVFINDRTVAKVVVRSMDLPLLIDERPKFVVFPRAADRSSDRSVLPGLTYKMEGIGSDFLRWQSKYGSVVMTSADLGASDGLNEKGLAAHVLELADAAYEPKDGRAELPSPWWTQYVLDNFATVSEVVEAHRSGKFRVTAAWSEAAGYMPGIGVHLAVEDASGDSAIFEHIKGELVIHHGPEYRVMTNEPPLDEMLERIKRYKPFGGTEEIPGTIEPEARFARLAAEYKYLPDPETYTDAMAGAVSLIRVAQVPFRDPERAPKEDGIWAGERTKWISAADLTNKIYYINSATSPSAFWLDLDDVSLDAGAPVLFLDPYDMNIGGNARADLKPWSAAG
ncbi:MAG: linear amide C-N hydrolase [Methyloceanibacter sp.]